MKPSFSLGIIASALTAFTLISDANADRVNHRQVRQRARIHQGVESGELTRAEAARLRAGQRHVGRVEDRVKADGEVTPAEAARLEGAQDRQSRRIFEQKHDGQKSE